MDIALIAPHSIDDFAGGVERVAFAEARALKSLGHRVRLVVGSTRTGGLLWRRELEGLELVCIERLPAEVAGLEHLQPRVIEAVRRATAGAEVVHLHHWYTLSEGLIGALAGEQRLCVSLHDHYSDCPRFFRARPDGQACPRGLDAHACAGCVASALPDASARDLERRLHERARRFEAELEAARWLLVPSTRHARRLAASFPRLAARFHPLAPGIDPRHARRVGRAFAGAEPLVVLSMGRRSPEKGSLDLVRALAALGPGRARLLLPGGSRDAAFDRELSEAAAGRLALELSGAYEPGGLADLAARAHLAAFPSRLPESYLLVADEALALGLPVWTSAAVVGERMSGSALRLLPPAEPVAWTAAFQSVLEDPGTLARARLDLPRSVRTALERALELERLFAADPHHQTLAKSVA